MEAILRDLSSDILNIRDAIIRIEDRVTDVEEVASATSWSLKGLQAQMLGSVMDGSLKVPTNTSCLHTDTSFSVKKQQNQRLNDIESVIEKFNIRLSVWERDTEMLRHLLKDSDKERTLKSYIKDLSKVRGTPYSGDPIGIKTSQSLQKAFDAEDRAERLHHENKQLRLQLNIGQNSLLHAFSSRPKIVKNTGSALIDMMTKQRQEQTRYNLEGSSNAPKPSPELRRSVQPRPQHNNNDVVRTVPQNSKDESKSNISRTPQHRHVEVNRKSSLSTDTHKRRKPVRSASASRLSLSFRSESETLTKGRRPSSPSARSGSSWTTSMSAVEIESPPPTASVAFHETDPATEQIDFLGSTSDATSETHSNQFSELSHTSFIRER